RSSCWKSCRVVNTSFSRPSRSSSRRSQPKNAASRMSLSGATSNRTITPGSLNSRAPRYTNSTPSVVFPVPAVPVTRMMFPRGPSQKPGGDQGFERVFHLREVIPDILGQAFADEEGPRMPIEEEQEIEIARVLQAADSVKEIADSPWRHARWRHARGPQDACPPKEGQRGAKLLTGRAGPIERLP